MFFEQVGDDSAKNIAADTADHSDANSHLDQVHGGVGRATAAGQQHAVRHDQLAGSRQVGYGSADMVGNDDARTEDFDLIAHGLQMYHKGLVLSNGWKKKARSNGPGLVGCFAVTD